MHLYRVFIELADIGFCFNIKVYRCIYFTSSKILVYELSTHVLNWPLREVKAMHVGAVFYVKSCNVVFFFYVLYYFAMLDNKAPSAVVWIKEHWLLT